MRTNLFKTAALSIPSILIGINLLAQPQASIYTDLGRNVVNDGLIIKNAGLVNYQYGKYKTEAGFQTEFNSSKNVSLSGFAFKFSRAFLIKKFPLEVQSFFLVTPISSVLRETNWGIMSSLEGKHLKMSIGTNFRTFANTSKAIKNYDIRSNTKIHEIWNLIYSFSYYIKPLKHPCNVAFSITNLDYFTIEHETNPILILHGFYKLNSRLNFFVEIRCKENFPFNFNMNYFGISQRTGITLNI